MSKLHESYLKEVDNFFNALPESSFETVPCPLCLPHHDKFHLFSKGTMEVYRCSCGHVYSERQPKQEALDIFYAKSHAMTEWSNLKETDFESKRQRSKYEDIIEFIERRKVQSVLDIGCGNGFFLSMLPKHINGFGVDQNENAVKFAKAKGLNASVQSIEETLEKVRANNHQFDCITLFGVLEHVKHPIELLKQLYKITRKYLVIIVPNVGSAVVTRAWKECFTFCPQHLNYFSHESISAAFEGAGFNRANSWTIEPEAKPIIRANYGLPFYGDIPMWAEQKLLNYQEIKRMEDKILDADKGYKIVYIGEKA